MDKVVSAIAALGMFIGTQTATLLTFQANQHIVCIDPGHGGDDPGALNQDLTEADLTLDIAKKLRTSLEEQKYKVVMTRVDNITDPKNDERAEICNKAKADILVSIHLNASSDFSIRYSQGLYGTAAKDKALTDVLHESLRSELGLPERAEGTTTDFADNVLLKSTMPATLQETTFITSTDEYSLLKDGKRQEQIAKALMDGINQWFASQKYPLYDFTFSISSSAFLQLE